MIIVSRAIKKDNKIKMSQFVMCAEENASVNNLEEQEKT